MLVADCRGQVGRPGDVSRRVGGGNPRVVRRWDSAGLEVATKSLANDVGGSGVLLDGAIIEGLSQFGVEAHRNVSAHRHDLKEVRGAVWAQVEHLPVILIRNDHGMMHRM
jgi:hypothetical protein